MPRRSLRARQRSAVYLPLTDNLLHAIPKLEI